MPMTCHPRTARRWKSRNPCGKQTIGLLQRRHVKIGRIRRIGKESNSLEEVESGLIHSEESVYTNYPDEEYEWKTEILPALRKVRLVVLEKKCGKRLSRRALIEARSGRSVPHRKNREFIESILKALGRL
jgi:hypothetical protein